MSAWGFTADPADAWRDRAACRGEDPELFFTEGSGQLSQVRVELAKAVCRRCQAKDECLAWAVRVRDRWAVCGGMTPAERRPLIADLPPPPPKVRKVRPSWCVNCPRQLGPDDRGRMCNHCRQAHTDVRVRDFGAPPRHEVLGEQFPPAAELVQELPGVQDRPRRIGRPAVAA